MAEMHVGVVFDPAPPVVDESLRQATAEGDAGNYGKAIELLRSAYTEIEKAGSGYPAAVFLRLPRYLQQSGRSNEAWTEYQRLLVVGCPGWRPDSVMLPMEHSHVYDKMRLFLQREGHLYLAVGYRVLSYVSFADSIRRQRRFMVLRDMKAPESIRHEVERDLKKARRLDVQAQIVSLICECLKFRPPLTDTDILARVKAILGTTESFP